MTEGIFTIKGELDDTTGKYDAVEGHAELRGESMLVISVRGQVGFDDHDLYCDLREPKNCKTVICQDGAETTWQTRHHDLVIDETSGYVEFCWFEGDDEWFVYGTLPALRSGQR
ncbi:hypothetical protein [Enterobacter hormaechei]|uniref:hypothetical protein n=1 Tax=Enterobacter hormaechei TaxID=158836 RepID=UPI00277BACB7|nr:hypothetical protein [Enterobacter hormaechei]MDY3571636.1 hypothetical protein [Enterobacter hormaechei]HDS5592951.1 hypothetical protein [Enterobacter hormaechei subsp. xiangfangensis]